LAGVARGAGIWGQSGTTTLRFTNTFGNLGAPELEGGVDVTDASNFAADPQYLNRSGDATSWALTLQTTSPARDEGDPMVSDPDGSRSDVGAFGGPGGTW
ncbi:MAG: hypothetical protein AAF602_19320, partial [Myxococcota bacterium]